MVAVDFESPLNFSNLSVRRELPLGRRVIEATASHNQSLTEPDAKAPLSLPKGSAVALPTPSPQRSASTNALHYQVLAPRFFASPYKNAVATTAKKEGWWAELPVTTSSSSDSADLVRTSSEYWLAQATSAGHLICLPYDKPGKFNSHPPTLQVSSKAITSFDVSLFDDLVAAGNDDGHIAVRTLPSIADFDQVQHVSSPLATLYHPTGRAIESLSFHPTTSNILLSSSKEHLGVFDVSSGAAEPVFSVDAGSPVWSAGWSGDGRFVSCTTKDGKLSLFDIRVNSAKPSQQVLAHGGQKCSRHVWLSDDKILTTGFSKMRDREYALFDGRNLGSPIKSNRVDTSTAAFVPVADVERGIVYLAGKGDMTLRWVEIGGPNTFTEGGTPVPIMIASMALTPPSQLNLMKAEINRLIVVTTDAVVPIPIEVPRRQYIDFHSDLFPPVHSRVPAQDAKAWLDGQDMSRDLVPQDPHKKVAPVKPQTSALSPPTPPTAAFSKLAVKDEPAAAVVAVHAPSAAADARAAVPAAPIPAPLASPAATSVTAQTPTTMRQPVAPADVKASTPLQSAATPESASKPVLSATTRFNPRWSRKFLSGKTPLKPDYHDVHGLSATMSAETQMLKANISFFFFPLAGAGGRLGVHPLAAKGRLPTAIPSFVCGANIVDFETDPFDPHRVFVAGDDSKIRIFRVPDGGLAADSGDTVAILHDSKMDRIHELKSHPSAKNLLLSTSDDHGHPTLRLWDLDSGAVLKSVPVAFGAISSTAWSPDGGLLAIATKTKKIVILDPRSDAAPVTCASHDSIRPVRVAWLSPTHLVSTGFSRSATREVILYAASATLVKQAATKSLDVSPAPLFPFIDVDSNILLLYSRGERSCHAFEVHPEDSTPFGVLPSFEHGTLQSGFAFLPKKHNDIKGAEVLHALRLTPSTVEVVAFGVPRARVEFFQDDIFIPTRDIETPALSAQEWVSGNDVPLRRIDLCPPGLTPLSEAPETAAVMSTRSKIAQGPTMTESQKADEYMNRLFAAAKADGDEEEPDRTSHRPQDDDDW